MIHKLELKNFKKIKNEVFLFDNFDLLVGANNSGKSTVLQALAIWQYCITQFKLKPKKGSSGMQIVLPDFTALPLPEFNLLWTDKVDREYKINDVTNKREQIYITVDIDVFWKEKNANREVENNFCIQLRYQSPQVVYAIPKAGWSEFQVLKDKLPTIVYVPPFSGLEKQEKWMDDGVVRQFIGKSQPGSVLRNLLYRVVDKDNVNVKDNREWQEIKDKIKDWFGVDLLVPKYEKTVSIDIGVEYKDRSKKTFDIISAGSGFHQILTLLAFYYGYSEATTILFDEPDAHLHTNLQRKIIDYFVEKDNKQFLIATHSPEFIRKVEMNNIVSILSGVPKKILSVDSVINALSDVDNSDVLRTIESPYIIYIEGEDDDRILSAWSNGLEKNKIYEKYYPYLLRGASKEQMRDLSQKHFTALNQIVPNVKRLVLLDYDREDTYHPDENNPCLKEWKRKNIDNYLLVDAAWKRAIANKLSNGDESDLFIQPYFDLIDEFFIGENLTLPKNKKWRDIDSNIFQVVDGKKILFENSRSLFHQIKNKYKELNPDAANELLINRQAVASAMLPEEIHQDVYDLFDSLEENIVNY